ncbi:hypothetical protein Tco_0333163, partial [Tanacetum coccineum]
YGSGGMEKAQETPVINDLTMVLGSISQKYSLGDHCRLFVADGASFSLIPIRAHSEEFGLKGDDDLLYKEWTSKRPWKLISHKEDPEMIYYGLQPRVVGLKRRVLDAERTDDLTVLQVETILMPFLIRRSIFVGFGSI